MKASKQSLRGPSQTSGRHAARQQGNLSRGAMLGDICLVAAWGAMIPGLMWLGVAAGF